MTNDTTSLLAHLAWRFPGATEDVATEALAFILNKEERARAALRDLLQESGADLAPIASTHTQRVYENRMRPDLVAFDSDEREVALIESKFWASLTSHQPNSYLKLMINRLPEARNLLFVAPDAKQGGLWEELRAEAEREFDVGDTSEKEGVRAATVGSDGHCLMLTSWKVLLGRMPDTDGELRQLVGLCAHIEETETDSPPEDNTRDLSSVSGFEVLIEEAVWRVRGDGGLVSTKGLRVARWEGNFGRYIQFMDTGGTAALATVRIGVDFRRPEPPLFLSFTDNNGLHSPDDMERIRSRLKLDADDCLPIHLPDGSDFQSAVEHIVERLKEIRDRLA